MIKELETVCEKHLDELQKKYQEQIVELNKTHEKKVLELEKENHELQDIITHERMVSKIKEENHEKKVLKLEKENHELQDIITHERMFLKLEKENHELRDIISALPENIRKKRKLKDFEEVYEKNGRIFIKCAQEIRLLAPNLWKQTVFIRRPNVDALCVLLNEEYGLPYKFIFDNTTRYVFGDIISGYDECVDNMEDIEDDESSSGDEDDEDMAMICEERKRMNTITIFADNFPDKQLKRDFKKIVLEPHHGKGGGHQIQLVNSPNVGAWTKLDIRKVETCLEKSQLFCCII